MRIFSDKFTLAAGQATNGYYRIWTDAGLQYAEGNTITSVPSAKLWKSVILAFEFVVAVGSTYRKGVYPDALIMGQDLTQSVALPLKPNLYAHKLSWTGKLPIDYGFGYMIYPGSLEADDVATMTVMIADKGEV